MSHNLETVVYRLKHHHNSALVVVHDTETEHISYWDKSTQAVEARALEYMDQQGFSTIRCGARHCDDTGRKQAWIEYRRDDTCDISGGGVGV